MTPDESHVSYARYLLEEKEYPVAVVAGRIDRVTPSSLSKTDVFSIVNHAQDTDPVDNTPDQSDDNDNSTQPNVDNNDDDDNGDTTTSNDESVTSASSPDDEPGASSWSA